LKQAADLHGGYKEFPLALFQFVLERLRYVLEQRGFDPRNVRAVTHQTSFDEIVPVDALRKLQVLPEFTESSDFRQLAIAFKRVRNIAKELPVDEFGKLEAIGGGIVLSEPAERALSDELDKRSRVIDAAALSGQGYRDAFAEAARFKPTVDKFFDDVLVMAPEPLVRQARLRLLRRLEILILKLGDISEIVPEEKQA